MTDIKSGTVLICSGIRLVKTTLEFGLTKKVSESMWCDSAVRKANGISGYDNVSLENI